MTALSQNKQVLPIDTDTTTILPYTTTQAQANCDPACQMPGSSPLTLQGDSLALLWQFNLFLYFFVTFGKKKRFATESR